MLEFLTKKRKGSIIEDPLFILVGLLSTVVMLFVAKTLLTNLSAANVFPELYMSEASYALSVYNYGIVVVNVMMYLVSIILALRIRTNPVFIVPAIIFNALGVWIAAEFSNIFWSLASSSAFAQAANSFPVLLVFMKNLPLFIGGFNFLLIIGSYVLPRERFETVQQ